MKIGILTLSRIETGQNQFYNAQDMGLAQALCGKGHRVTLYRLTRDFAGEETKNQIRIISKKVSGLGRQSICQFHFLDKELERLICFSDNQLSYPSLYKWCNKQGVPLLPYIGVIQSNSPQKWVQALTDRMVERNLRLYRRQKIYGKTPDVVEKLVQAGCTDTALAPVCLNAGLLKADYQSFDSLELRKEFGFEKEHRILLFIGRLEQEKEPLEILEVLRNLIERDKNYRLLLVGKGSMEGVVAQKIEALDLQEYMLWLKQIPNEEIWKLYRISDCFVNLNRHEIYGMSILEALYYDCPVAAWRAPGPDFILNAGEAGHLVERKEDLESILEKVCRGQNRISTNAYLLSRLSWEKVCEVFLV